MRTNVTDTGLSSKKLAKRNRRARRNLALKLSLEAVFFPEVRRYFNRVAREVSLQVSNGERPQVTQAISNQTSELLRVQYRRVARSFTNEMRLFLSEKAIEIKQTEEEDRMSESVNMATSVFIASQALIRANLIDRTTQDEIETVSSETLTAELEAGNATTGATFSAVLANKLRAVFSSRFKTVTMTETQFSSEKVKHIEAAVVSRGGQLDPVDAGISELLSGRIDGEPSTRKEWATILDQVTRAAHVVADGQTQPINEPFIVDSEFLMEPGDPRLGASPGNLINCRCSALYSI